MKKIESVPCSIFIILLTALYSQIQWVHAIPQWGVPAAADAANAIDAERFQAINSAAAFEAVNNQVSHEAQPLPVPFSPSSFASPEVTQGIVAPPPPISKRKQVARRKLKKKKGRKGAKRGKGNGIHHSRRMARTGIPTVPRQQRHYYPHPAPQPPLQNWGFWKWGQDNFSKVLATLFSH